MSLTRGPGIHQEIQLLNEMVAMGASVVRSAGAFDRTTAAVRRKLISLGHHFNRIELRG
jgi:hypothetical protein